MTPTELLDGSSAASGHAEGSRVSWKVRSSTDAQEKGLLESCIENGTLPELVRLMSMADGTAHYFHQKNISSFGERLGLRLLFLDPCVLYGV